MVQDMFVGGVRVLAGGKVRSGLAWVEEEEEEDEVNFREGEGGCGEVEGEI